MRRSGGLPRADELLVSSLHLAAAGRFAAPCQCVSSRYRQERQRRSPMAAARAPFDSGFGNGEALRSDLCRSLYREASGVHALLFKGVLPHGDCHGDHRLHADAAARPRGDGGGIGSHHGRALSGRSVDEDLSCRRHGDRRFRGTDDFYDAVAPLARIGVFGSMVR